METVELNKTARREARESYCRYILQKANISDEDAEAFLTTKQVALLDKSPLELIYTGEIQKATEAVEAFVDGNEA